MFKDLLIKKNVHFKSTWKSPANIAFVKYWGKIGKQIPANPSLSMTLKECYTETSVEFSENSCLSVELYLDSIRNDSFAVKIKNYLESLLEYWPELSKLKVVIYTKNTFPQGTGIASSASGLSAFALAFTEYLYFINSREIDSLFYRISSNLARLASGSASRSVYGGFVSWGDLSNDYATVVEDVHSIFSNLQDTVLIISDKEKKVSSTGGHQHMGVHPFKEARYQLAKFNYAESLKCFKNGDLEKLGIIIEQEALTLHALMMSSHNPYILLRPNSLLAIEMVKDFREQTKLPLYFTLDAGPNLHLIYPSSEKNKIQTFINHELSQLSIRVIHDEMGMGPCRL